MLGGTNSRNKQLKHLSGYTIIEVLIVLAVSGMMFVIAANFINGKQGKAAFTQGVNEMGSQIQKVIEQVNDGQYSDIPINCTFNGTTTNPNQSGSRPPGTNSTCVFLGKLLRFNPDSDSATYNVISLAGGRVTSDDISGNPVTPTIANTHPAVINELTNTQSIPQQLKITKVTVTDVSGASSTGAYNFGFSQGLGNVDKGSFQSGAQTITMIYSQSNDVDGQNLSYAHSATMCMTDGERFALVLIGSDTNNASQLSVRRQVVPSC